MSFGIAIYLTEKKITKQAYSHFLNLCAQIGGEWSIYEHAAFDLNSDETVHDCVLVDQPNKYTKAKKELSVWVTLSRQHFFKKYGRSRREIHWQIYTVTKAGRNLWSYIVQLIIPLKAFTAFSDIIVVVEPERVFLEPENYRDYVKKELVASFGEEALRQNRLIDADGRLMANGV